MIPADNTNIADYSKGERIKYVEEKTWKMEDFKVMSDISIQTISVKI